MDKKTDTPREISLFIPRSYLTTEGNKTGSWRFLRPRYEEKTAPCSAACPAAEDIGMIQMLTMQGSFKDAWETILRENPFPGVCGRVCFHPCEGVCNRGEFDEAIAIHVIERFLANTAHRNAFKPEVKRLDPKTQKIAVIGAGPGGLSAAYFLTLLGYGVDIFEGASEPGGVLRWGIPSYRLPPAVLEEEILRIEEIGVRIQTGKRLAHRDMDTLGKKYDALFLACGHGRSMALGIPGEELEGVQDGLSFLREIREGRVRTFSGQVAVIGGGNAAVDVARSIVRLGGKALIIYRRRRQDMPAFGEEIEMALGEGVELRELLSPSAIRTDGDDLVLQLRAMKVVGTDTDGRAHIETEEDETEEIRVSRLFTAIGERAGEPWYESPEGEDAVLRLSHCVMAHKPGGIFVYGGDLTNGIKSVAHAVASGKEAALDLLPEIEERFAGIFDRRWAAIEPVECDDAEIILVTSGTVTSTCRELIGNLRKQGEKVGLLKIKLFRPFPVEAIRRILVPAKKVAVIDRNFSFGASGIFAQEIRAALCNSPGHPPVFGFVAGLGGRDITKDVLEGIYRQTRLSDRPEREDIWIGLKEVHDAAERS